MLWYDLNFIKQNNKNDNQCTGEQRNDDATKSSSPEIMTNLNVHGEAI